MATQPRDSALYIPLWLLMAVAAGCSLIALIMIGVAMATRTADRPQPTATVQLVTVAAPATQSIVATFAVTEQSPVAGPSATLPPPPSAGDIKIGSTVQIVGTGDIGFLNLRAEASLDAAINYLAIEREVFQVQAGPVEADGVVWWYLVDLAGQNRVGWGAQNYLQVVSGQ
ncbi:MAG: hypothetical protein ACT4QE_22430 [Anaerolineales bacterium]